MRHARREPAHRGQPLAGDQLGLRPGEPLVGRSQVLELPPGEHALRGERRGGPAEAGLEAAQERASAPVSSGTQSSRSRPLHLALHRARAAGRR